MLQAVEMGRQLPQNIEIQKNNHLSFNLSHERDRALEASRTGNREQMKLARDGFIQNTQYWAKEYIGGIQTTHYLWHIVDDGGKTRLYHPSFGYADDASQRALEQNVPEYEKKRRQVEHNVTKQFSQVLKDAHKGDVFVWTSPPPEVKGIEKGVYGGYTMTHLYEVDEVTLNEGGKTKSVKILKGRDVKNYLKNEEHKELLETLGEQKIFEGIPSSLDLLATLVKVKYGTSSRDVETKIKQIEKYLGPSENETKVKEFEKILQDNEWMLERIFQMLILEDVNISQAFITNYFKQYAQAIELAQSKGSDKTLDALGFVAHVAAGGSCGAGVGFGDAAKNAFGYQPTALAASLSGERTLKCKECPLCKSKDIEAVIKDGKIQCPSCMGSAEYAC